MSKSNTEESKSNTKESESPTTAASSNNNNNNNTTAPNNVISLIEEEENQITEALKRSIGDAFASFTAASKKRKRAPPETIIVLSDSDDDDNDGGGKLPNTAVDIGEDSDDSDIMVMDEEEAKAALRSISAAVASTESTMDADGDGDDEDIVDLGTKNGMNLPHMRQHCTKHKFVENAAMLKTHHERTTGKKSNSKSCEKCFCYVCDTIVSECKSWETHCNASDKGRDKDSWKRLRDKAKNKNNPQQQQQQQRGFNFDNVPNFSSRLFGSEDEEEDDEEGMEDMRDINMGYDRGHSYRFFHEYENGSDEEDEDEDEEEAASFLNSYFSSSTFGVYEPGKFKVSPNSDLVKQCRKCNWWNRINSHHKRVISPFDWCQMCGRVLCETSFNKNQSSPYKPQTGDVSLGTKCITFRIKGRDPRKIDPYAKNWKEKEGEEGWVYHEEEMKDEFFRHRIGERPTVGTLLDGIPILEESKIPDSGSVTLIDCDKAGVSGFETEALILDNHNDKIILEELHRFHSIDIPFGVTLPGMSAPRGLGRDLHAKWDKTTQTGSITISLYLTAQTTQVMNIVTNTRTSFAHLLGAWHSAFPFKLSELTAGLPIIHKMTQIEKKLLIRNKTGLRPSTWGVGEGKRLLKTLDEDEALENYKKEAEEVSSRLSFISSSGSKCSGGICDNDVSFRGTLRRYFRETWVDDIAEANTLANISYDEDCSNSNYSRYAFGVSPAGRALGIQSMHREMRGPSVPRDHRSSRLIGTNGIRSYLEGKDLSLLGRYFTREVKQKQNTTETINGILGHLENLHHEPVEHIDGLNVELFDFQREAVGWATERERLPGGLQGLLWTKLPNTNKYTSAKKLVPVDVYYSPILDSFMKEKPADVRGGIIAEQMGLGKTVISLAVILQNPAPQTPVSGSLVADDTPSISTRSTSSLQWPIERPTAGKRANYFCRGTLVVCNVSLVGQWIDEAKSKLEDPGLVYSYHGANRKRCPKTLAKNAIVVTTYATLASDANHHKKKSLDPNYCAPCEQIWWWRIICDESHVLKTQTNGLFRTVTSIRAASKWCVTGTPMNTSLSDLRGQLTFLGIQKVPQLFSLFESTMKEHFRYNNSNRRQSLNSYASRNGDFLFLMRNIMMRHSIQMKSRVEEANIMTLPPKEEKVIKIRFTKEERKEYEKVEKLARRIYQQIKSNDPTNISKNYLKISSALLPLRIACSGGQLTEAMNSRAAKAGKGIKEINISTDYAEDVCPICLSHVEDARATPCKPVAHIYCKDCIENCFAGAQTMECPVCRAKVKAADICSVKFGEPKVAEDDITKNALKGTHKKKQRKIDDLIFKSKFERLIVELKLIRDIEPQSKSLVFSQFSSTLQWMKQELPKHGFEFRTLSGDMSMSMRAKALRDFQQDPSTTVFLLSMRSGAVGINLTQANRVFLMEPAVNPALEAQAVGRVYRLGQRKSVQVLRMQVENSIETRMAAWLLKKYDAPRKPGADENSTALSSPSVGHMSRDKAQILEDEFDLLFGV